MLWSVGEPTHPAHARIRPLARQTWPEFVLYIRLICPASAGFPHPAGEEGDSSGEVTCCSPQRRAVAQWFVTPAAALPWRRDASHVRKGGLSDTTFRGAADTRTV